MPRRVAPEAAICEGLAMMLRLLPNLALGFVDGVSDVAENEGSFAVIS